MSTSWKYTLLEDGVERVERHRAFWKGQSIKRPLVYACVSNQSDQTTSPSKQNDLNETWHINRISHALNQVSYYGDAIPNASLMVGLDITHNVILAGGDYDYSSNGEQIYYSQGSFELEKQIQSFDHNHILVKLLEQCYKAVVNQVGCKTFVNTPMTLDPFSSLYSLMGESFLKSLVKRPTAVHDRLNELTTHYLEFYDYFYAFLKNHGYGESASWLNVYCEGKFESVRCDFSVMLSQHHFESFAIPMLNRICTHMDQTLFNMSSVNHRRFSKQLSTVNALSGYFWNPEPFYSGIQDYIEDLKTLKTLKPCLEIVCYNVDDAILATQKLGSDGLYILFPIPFEKESDAIEAIAQIAKAAKR